MAGPVTFRADSWVKSATGQAITGAHLYWCTQPITLPALEASGVPNQAVAFVDSTGQTTTSQPISTDAFGHADVYLNAGLYTLAVYVNGQLQNSYADQAVVGGGLASLNGLTGNISLQSAGSIQIQNVGQTIALSITQGFPANPIVGDTLKFNALGDNAWDAVMPCPMVTGFVGGFGGVVQITQSNDAGNGILGINGQTFTSVNPTATSYAAETLSNAATASLSTICGCAGPTNSASMQNFLGHNRLTFKLGFTLNTNCRYWVGLSCWNPSSTFTGNQSQPIANSAYATDTPNKTTLAFRYSPGTDTTWKACSFVVGASSPTSTIVDTGITPTSTPAIFEIIPNSNGTSVQFWYNYTLVATISTNLPPMGTADGMASIFCCGDNKNTNNAPAITVYYALMSLKGYGTTLI